MISDLDRPEGIVEGPRRWALPAAASLTLAAFLGLALVVAADTRAPRAPAAAAPAPEAAVVPASGPAVSAATAEPSVAVAIPADGSRSLGLPAAAYRTVARVVNSSTTGLYPAEEEPILQLRYRLADDRAVTLVRLPRSDPLRGIEPGSYTTEHVVVRGIEARLLSGRTALEPTILLWTEGIRSYQLYSSALSAQELIGIAELLR